MDNSAQAGGADPVPSTSVADAYAAPTAVHGSAIRIGAIVVAFTVVALIAVVTVAGLAVTKKVKSQPEFSSRRPVPRDFIERQAVATEGQPMVDPSSPAAAPAAVTPQP
ncbi:MAG: hypothetical protein U0892_13455 [Pirellulales bacterium]